MSAAPDSSSTENYRSLRGRLVFVYLGLALSIGLGSAYFIRGQYVLPLQDTAQQLQAAHADHVFDWLSAQIQNIDEFSLAFNAIAESAWGDAREMRLISEKLLSKLPPDSPVLGAGIWPEPKTLNRNAIRQSLYWTVDSTERGRVPSFHGDYNDPDRISYFGEIWYAPLRWHKTAGCHFTRRYKEPFLAKPVIACAYPIEVKGQFVGVSSLIIDVQAWKIPSSQAEGFHLILDRDQQILASSGLKVSADDNLATAGQTDQRLGPIAVQLHQAAENNAQQLKASDPGFQDAARELARQVRNLPERQAALLLAQVQQPGELRQHQLQVGGVNGRDTAVRIWHLPRFGSLVAGSPGPAMLAGQPRNELVAAASEIGAVSLALLLALLLSWRLTVTPMRRLLTQLQLPPEDTQLDSSAPSEWGAIASLINRRHERIRALLDTGVRSRASSRERPVASGKSDAVSSSNPMDALPEAVVTTDAQGMVTYLNKAAENLSGWTLEAATGLNFDDVFHLSDRRGKSRLSQLPSRAIQAKRASERPLAAQFMTRSGHKLPLSVATGLLYPDSGGEAPNGVVLMLHNRRADLMSSGGSASSMKDSLTGMLNRTAFDAELNTRCEATRMGADEFHLLFLDIDDIKAINSHFGTEAGDEFLRQLARLIQSDVGEHNPVYRLQGDKFGIMLDTTDSAEAQVTAELLRADAQSWGFQWKGDQRNVTVSLGLIKVDRNSGRSIDVLRAAAELCLQAQAEGGGKVLMGEARNRPAKESRDERYWLTNIKRGLAENLFHLSTRQVKALQRDMDAAGQVFDSLLLLEDDEGFWTGADVFMPIAERHDLSMQLDKWTFERIFEKLHQDQDLFEKMDFCMVSISIGSMQNISFLDFLMERFQQDGIPRSKICIDLKESDVYTRLSTAREFCQALARAGCRLSLSQVSTQPASYRLIKELPIQLVRFDPLITRHAHEDPLDRVATESLHRIARALNKKSMVEQVDSPELLRVLQGIGIDYAVGDAVARASPLLFQTQV